MDTRRIREDVIGFMFELELAYNNLRNDVANHPPVNMSINNSITLYRNEIANMNNEINIIAIAPDTDAYNKYSQLLARIHPINADCVYMRHELMRTFVA